MESDINYLSTQKKYVQVFIISRVIEIHPELTYQFLKNEV